MDGPDPDTAFGRLAAHLALIDSIRRRDEAGEQVDVFAAMREGLARLEAEAEERAAARKAKRQDEAAEWRAQEEEKRLARRAAGTWVDAQGRRVVRLDALTEPERRLVLALVDAAKT